MGEVYIITCPKCGKTLFKGTSTEHIEVLCPRCREKMNIAMMDNKVTVECCSSSEEAATKRMEAYQNCGISV